MDVPPISASQGPMRSLPAKLDSLLLAPEYKLWKRVRNKIRLLKGDLEELVAKYLMEPSEVDYPAATAACWVMEARELSYDIDDFVDELVHAIAADARITLPKKRPPFHFNITRVREKLNLRRWVKDEVSRFRTKVKEAIERHRTYLHNCSFRPWLISDERPLPPPPHNWEAAAGLAGNENSMEKQAILGEMKEVFNLCYNNLPHCLKACMLYLSMYQKDYKFWKRDLVKQWVAEGFIGAIQGKDVEEVAGSYFDELVERGMIQPVDTNYNGEVLSCTVHCMVLNLIRYKSIQENFIIVVDHSQTDIRLAKRVRRLALHFGNINYATPPSNLRDTQVRTLAFSGLFKCIPPIVEFQFLRVLILKLWVNPDDMSYDLTGISKLFRLRYLCIDACHGSVELPTQMQRLKDLMAMEIKAKVTAVPSDIIDVPGLLYLSLPSETDLPTGIGRMTSLRALGHFDLSSNSVENLQSLGELTNLRDLRLTCSTVPPDCLKSIMKCLSSVLGKLSNLKSLTLLPDSSTTNTLETGASSIKISYDLSGVSSPPALLQTLELLPRICIFSVLPRWIKQLHKLCILKIEVMGLWSSDIDILSKLPALSALSMYVHSAPEGRIVFEKEGFLGLKYFKFMCTAPCVSFLEGAMLNVQRLKLGFSDNRMEQSLVDAGFEHLIGLKEISVKIGNASDHESDRRAAESALVAAISKHPSSPIVNVTMGGLDFWW